MPVDLRLRNSFIFIIIIIIIIIIIDGSTALLSGLDRFCSFLITYTVCSSWTEHYNKRHKRPCLEWDSNPLPHWVGEVSSCLRPHGRSDQLQCNIGLLYCTIAIQPLFYTSFIRATQYESLLSYIFQPCALIVRQHFTVTSHATLTFSWSQEF
jgi:hypothetical protein